MSSEDPSILWDVLEEHLDEAEFLWTQWQHSLDSPIHSFEDASTRVESRLLAHIDGLIVGGKPAAGELLRAALDADEPARVAVAASALLAAESGDELPEVIDAAKNAESEAQLEGTMLALERSPRAEIGAKLIALLGGEADGRVLRAIAFRRLDAGDVLKRYFSSSDPQLRAAAILAARSPQGQKYRGFVARAISAAEPELRDAAIETGLILGMETAWNAALELALTHDAGALSRIAVLGGESEKSTITAAKSALFALGFSGWKAAAEICRELLADKKLGPLAGESFCAITGLDPSNFEKNEKKEEPEQPIALADDDLDADLVPPPEDSLPLLDADEVNRWWKTAHTTFDPKLRYLFGEPWSPATIIRALTAGRTWRRRGFAFALAVRTKGRIDLPTLTWTSQQRLDLGSLNAAELTVPIGRLMS